jgi:Uma2 family endonuclease
VILHGVSWDTYKRLVNETGENRKARFAYDSGDFEIRASTEGHVVLREVSWETYMQLMDETGEDRRNRFAYDDGDLEIMAPNYYAHEGSSRPFEHFLLVLVEEFGIDFVSGGELTCVSKEHLKGIEPDSCYYIQNAKKMIGFDGRTLIDFTKYPPPDLMVEIDMTNTSVPKLPICAALRVPEHWSYDGQKLNIRVLRDGAYVEVDESAIFPGLPLKEILPQLIQSRGHGFLAMTRTFRQWVRERLHPKAPRRTGKNRP